MPTKRTWSLLLIAVILYFLANQTQVGWIYLFVAGILGLLVVSFFYSRGSLKTIRAQRFFRNISSALSRSTLETKITKKDLNDFDQDLGGEMNLTLPTFFENDPIEVTLQFGYAGWRPAFLISGQEICPFASPAEQRQSFYIPTIFKNQPVTLSYQTLCDRRGLYTFPELWLCSNGPFGFFTTKRRLDVPSSLLIYPQYHPLRQLNTLERREFGQGQTAKVGLGTQVIGTREYRSGDSLRQVHWRSTARRNQLVVKEFSDDDQLTLTVVLDLEVGSNLGRGKISTFETAVRLAASFGYYATSKNIPFFLVGASQRGAPPKGALSWWAILNYLAKVKNDGDTSLAQVLDKLPATPIIIVLVSNPQAEVVKALAKLRQSSQVWVIFITPDGVTPESVKALRGSHLTITNATVDNWIEVLESL